MFFVLFFSLMNCLSAAAYAPFEFDFTSEDGSTYRIEMRPIETTLQDRLCLGKTYGSAIPMSSYMDGTVRSQAEIDKRFKNYTEWTNHKGYPWVCAMAFLKSVSAEESQLTAGQFLGQLVIEPWDDNGDAELSYVLVEGCWNKGICTALVAKLLELVIPCLKGNTHMYKIRKLWATARPNNVGSWKVLEKNNFSKEEGLGAVHSSTVETAAAPTDRWKYYIQIV